MSINPNITTISQTWTTESGFEFSSVDIAWNSWGELNAKRDNVILICHALTGHSDAKEWFSGLFVDGGIVDPAKHFVLCINNIGSCYGSTGPTSIYPFSGKPYQADFPQITIRDMVRFQQLLLDDLGITNIELAIGGSMGGMIALEFALMDQRVQSIALMAMGMAHSPWAIGISHAQRQAIFADKNWNNGFFDEAHSPEQGLAAARALAMITYRSSNDYESKFGRSLQPEKDSFQVESYLEYQGKKLSQRFDANSYVRLSQAMDSHDVSRNRDSYQTVLGNQTKPALVLGIDSDLLYPIHEQKELADLMPNSSFETIYSQKGHDAFLIEFDQINTHLSTFFNTLSKL